MVGFEVRALMVSKWWTPPQALRARQSKIYERIGSIDSLANFQRIKLKAITSDLSRTVSRIPIVGLSTGREPSDVLSAALGILARARARAAAARQDAGLG